jgi:hypothetical protein
VEFRPERRARRVIPCTAITTKAAIGKDSRIVGSYNPVQPMIKIIRLFYVFVLVCLAAGSAQGMGQWDTPAAEACRRILALAGNGPLSFEVVNASSIPQDQAKIIRQAIETNLRAQGVQLRAAAQGYATVRVTLSENIYGFVWIIQLPAAAGQKVSIQNIPREEKAVAATGAMSLKRTLIFAGKEQILDAAVLSKNGDHVVVLTPSFISVYRPDANTHSWSLEQAQSVPHQTYPRDLRGRLQMNSDGEFTAYLPGIRCHGNAMQQNSGQCANTDDPWWLAGNSNAFFNSARNHFTGVVPGLARTLPPFYSAVPVQQKTETWLVSTLDGKANLLDGTTLKAVSGTRDWGSDMASVRSKCGSGNQVIATGAGDSENDSLRAFEIQEQEAVPVSAPLVFEGAITALWTKPQGDTAVAVVRTSTGSYEAYSVSIACSQ